MASSSSSSCYLSSSSSVVWISHVSLTCLLGGFSPERRAVHLWSDHLGRLLTPSLSLSSCRLPSGSGMMFAPLWFSFVYFRHFTTFTLLMFTYRKVFLARLTWMTMTRRYCEVFPNNLSLMLVSENHKLLWLLIKYVNPRKRKGNFFNVHLVREFMQTQIPVEELKKHANRFTTN